MVETILTTATNEAIKQAGALIRDGNLVAFPTETVYGLGANAYDGQAVARIFEVKGRPQFNPLITHFANVEDALKEGVFNDYALELATRLWPAPLSLIVKKQKNSAIHDLVSAGLETIAVRVPNHLVAIGLIKQAGVPIAAPSANLSGKISPTNAMHVFQSFKDKVPYILSGGASQVGLESTVVDCSREIPVIVRRGFYDEPYLSEICGCDVVFEPSTKEKPISPGQILRHYAPQTKLTLGVLMPKKGHGYLAFGPTMINDDSVVVKNLSEKGDLVEAAKNLFSYLHFLDELNLSEISVAPIPNQGLGAAINDRLLKAASV